MPRPLMNGKPAQPGLEHRLAVLLEEHAALLPPTLLAGGTSAVLGAPTLNDLNEVANQALNALAPLLTEVGVAVTTLFDPAISPAAGSRAALVLLAASLIRQATLPRPAEPETAPAIDLVTGQAGRHGRERAGEAVCLEVSRVGVDVATAGWPLADLCQTLAGLLNARIEMHIEREEVAAGIRLPAAQWRDVTGQVWVLDTDATVREVCCRILARHEVATLAVPSGDDLAERLETGAPALLLISAGLTDPKRGCLVEWLARERPQLIERVVLLTSSPASDQTRWALAALGREWYLAKPFAADALLATVRRRLMCLEGPPAGEGSG